MQRVRQAHGIFRGDRDQADAHANTEGMSLPCKAKVLDISANRLTNDLGFVQWAVGQHQGKFIPAQSSHGITVAHVGFQLHGDLTK